MSESSLKPEMDQQFWQQKIAFFLAAYWTPQGFAMPTWQRDWLSDADEQFVQGLRLHCEGRTMDADEANRIRQLTTFTVGVVRRFRGEGDAAALEASLDVAIADLGIHCSRDLNRE